MTGKTQSYARQLNNQLIMRELRQGVCSATMLSHKLNLSNAALSSIISKLQQDGYIKQAEADVTVNKGRKPVYYTINERFGYIAVVSLGDYVATVVLADMKKNIVERYETRVERYDMEMLYELVLILKNMLASPEYRDIPLLGIDLSVPGKVNTQTGVLQLSPQFEADIYNDKNAIIDFFKRHFNAPIVMTNDTNLAGLGEMYSGAMQGVENGMLVHVDEGVGGALILNGKLFTGSQGFGGEIGIMRAEFMGKTDYVDEFVSLRAIKKKFGARHTKEIVQRYGVEQDVTDYVDATAVCLGRLLKDIVELLNISTIVLSGRIANFGQNYLELVQNEVAQSINDCSVVYSALGRDASIIGAISKAVEALTDDIFE